MDTGKAFYLHDFFGLYNYKKDVDIILVLLMMDIDIDIDAFLRIGQKSTSSS